MSQSAKWAKCAAKRARLHFGNRAQAPVPEMHRAEPYLAKGRPLRSPRSGEIGEVILFLCVMREVRINCRLTPEEQRQLIKAAREAKVPPSTLLRLAAFAYLEKQTLLPPSLEDLLRSLLQEARRSGTNLNQIAAKVNRLQRASFGDIRDTRRVLAQYEERIRELEALLRTMRPPSEP